MPKRPNHPHHHSASERRGLGFQPPTVGPFEARNPLNPTPYTYPKGWVLRPWYRSRSWPVRVFMFAWTAAIVAGLVYAIINALGVGR